MVDPTPDSFPSDPTYGFPFEPYSIQLDLMNHLYEALTKGKCTVIESPTGTVSLDRPLLCDSVITADTDSSEIGKITITHLVDAHVSRGPEIAGSDRARFCDSLVRDVQGRTRLGCRTRDQDKVGRP